MSKRDARKTAKHARTRIFVVSELLGWAVRGSALGVAQCTYKTQREAVAAARKMIKQECGGELVIHGRDGRIRGVDTYSVGADSFDKISAVEGILLSDEAKRDFRALDRKRLSPRERREWLIAKYGPQRDDIRRRK